MKYFLIKTENSTCSQCNGPVQLLAAMTHMKHPSFYICFRCEHVAEVGVGPVSDKAHTIAEVIVDTLDWAKPLPRSTVDKIATIIRERL